MDPDRRNRLVAVGALALFLVVALAFGAGLAFTENRTTVDSTVVTAQSGNVTASTDSLILVVRDNGSFADRIEERLETRLGEAGYAVAVAQNVEGHEGPLLAVDLARSDVDPGLVRHSARVTVETYYATDWNASAYRQYRETGAVEQRTPGATVAGEHAVTDNTTGLSTGYRGYVTDLVVDAVAESFRGDLSGVPVDSTPSSPALRVPARPS